MIVMEDFEPFRGPVERRMRSREDDMTVEDEQGSELTVETETDVEPESAAEVAADDDVEAHVWRAQS